MNKRLKKALRQSFTPPPAQCREQFVNSISYPKETTCELLISQMGFIRKRIWCLFMLGVCVAFFYTQFMGVAENVVSGVSAILPLLSLCTITEIYKGAACNMEELELACKYNLHKITLIRIGILGTVSFAVLFILVIFVGKSDFGMLRNTIYISVPYLLSSYLSLLIISKFRLKETVYICAAISGAVSVFMVIASSSYSFIYKADLTAIWVALFTILVGLLSSSLIQFIKSQGELQWNLA